MHTYSAYYSYPRSRELIQAKCTNSTRHLQVKSKHWKHWKSLTRSEGLCVILLISSPDIRADLVHLDDKWQQLNYPQLVESLRQWCNRNPKETSSRSRPNPKKDQAFQESTTPKLCVYRDAEDHKPAEC